LALFEPEHLLLVPNGLGYYEEILMFARNVLRPSGLLVCEIPHERAPQLAGAFQNAMGNVRILLDASGRERALVSYG
jgi:methylase of polypeptide subunit release factors